MLLLYFDGLYYIYTPTTLLLNTNTVKTIPKLTTFGFMATLMGCVDDLIHWFFVFYIFTYTLAKF